MFVYTVVEGNNDVTGFYRAVRDVQRKSRISYIYFVCEERV